MSTHATFRPYSPDQTLLFPPNMADALPEEHLVHFIRDLTGRLDLSAIYAAYNGTQGGQPPYHPQMMVGLLLMGIARASSAPESWKMPHGNKPPSACCPAISIPIIRSSLCSARNI